MSAEITEPNSLQELPSGKEGNPNASAYSASKAGVIGLTKSLGKELAGTDVRVNCIPPAAIRTPIFDQMAPEHFDFHAFEDSGRTIRDCRGCDCAGTLACN